MTCEKVVSTLATGLAKEAGVEIDAAERILKVLDIDKLEQTVEAHNQLSDSPTVSRLTGIDYSIDLDDLQVSDLVVAIKTKKDGKSYYQPAV